MGSDCGTVDSAVASDTRGLQLNPQSLAIFSSCCSISRYCFNRCCGSCCYSLYCRPGVDVKVVVVLVVVVVIVVLALML